MAAAGDKINGFTLVRQLGAGGMGETWEGVRVVGAEFEQRVAIKIADRESLHNAEGLELFRREASLAASLRHPNIAAVLDVDEHLGCIVCELVDGADLRAVLRVSPRSRLNATVLVHMLGQIARGLSHAHRRVHHGKLSPVVHRDMSPGNVVVDYDGNLKIVDFGIAKAIASADISETIKGKLSYMAPEQAMGTRVDGRVDQYALGVMAYEALAGMRPNDGAHDGETLANILSGKHMPLSMRGCDLPPGLADVIEKMLSVAPDERYPSMDAVIAALDPFTPPLTVHRELAELVLRARPAQTIVMQNGVFVSRPVAQETLHREPTPKSGRSRNLRGNAQNLAATDPVAPRDSNLKTSTHPQTPKSVPRPPPLPLVLPSAEPNSRRSTMREDEQASFRATGRPGAGRWQASLAALGALVLAALSWLVFSADLGSTTPTASSAATDDESAPSLGPKVPPSPPDPQVPTAVVPPSAAEPAPPANPTDPSEGLAKNTVAELDRDRDRDRDSFEDDSKAVEAKPRRPVRDKEKDKEKSAETTSVAKKNTAIARVSVFPWGRVWVDGKLQGSVPPILEVNLTPGVHEIAVGHERPMESRKVDLQPGTTPVSFDLEGR